MGDKIRMLSMLMGKAPRRQAPLALRAEGDEDEAAQFATLIERIADHTKTPAGGSLPSEQFAVSFLLEVLLKEGNSPIFQNLDFCHISRLAHTQKGVQ